MRRFGRSTAGFLVLATLWLGAIPAALATDPDTAGLQGLFDALAEALAAKDEAAFRARWVPEGYATNLVGGSGLAGREVFAQGSRKGWYLKPDLAGLRDAARGGAWLVPCEVWSRAEARALDHVWAHPTWDGTRWVLLGAGEDYDEVAALARSRALPEPSPTPAPAQTPAAPAPKAGDPRRSPVGTLELVFAAARDGALDGLAALCLEGQGDGDVRAICALADGQDPKKIEEFRAWFRTGRVTGAAEETTRDGRRQAAVPFVFGPDGTKVETMHLVEGQAPGQAERRWYLESF